MIMFNIKYLINFRCLEKNPDHRPFVVELMEHPFFTELPSNDYHVNHLIIF